ncbi:LuxR family transcriptional regulator [Mycolicibacterium cosmeticum]|uniref:Response regulator containing a CheY-like receiver domain and an HTH DNA-binding domain protein n=1 Tax=Mycolicibacterium cosmeticum TaxID=258533 RepID=W9BL94_MYCCO|nr:isoniazid response ATPase/transcriptional regulator IniR [Mycolicibacterium cosmeticum]TLH75003.1 LuxR family transcriptional regulator [Mycolicibacterium cosmeticum]CDO09255.1 response regulator containing a CheY-like receiver domain and an HTH DNA-binding domain protein [Mycolicibacterium cosmeticum]
MGSGARRNGASSADPLAGLIEAPTRPAKVLVSGGIGTGKTTRVSEVRSALRDAGRPVLSWVPEESEIDGAAIVIDDAELLDDDALVRLTTLVERAELTIVVAAAPLAHRAALGSLATALARENPVVTLGPLPPSEFPSLPHELVRAVQAATSGLLFLVAPVAAAVGTPDADSAAAVIGTATRVALVERLHRLGRPVLDALLLCSLSPGLGADDMAAALGIDADEAGRVMDHARATGLIDPVHRRPFLGILHRAVAEILGSARHHENETALLRSQSELGTLSTDLALRMAEHGLRDPLLADALITLATEHRSQPARAARLFRAAADAGAGPRAHSAGLADALAMTGDCTTAARLADDLLGSSDAAERAAAVRIAASIAAHDGAAGQAADLFRWLGPYPDAVVGSAAAMVAIGTGDAAAARAALAVADTGPPTSTARAARSLTVGLLATLDEPYAAAIGRLSQAITAERTDAGVTPDSPAALVTLAALHGGDAVRARSIIARAAGTDSADDHGFTAARHRLLLGWVRMQDGQLSAANADVATIPSAPHRRDALWAAALRTAIARRSGDGGAVQKYWYAAVEVLAEYSLDVYCTLPLGEVWVAAARLRQVDRIAHHIDEAFGLLAGLGNPVLWSVPLHWAGVHAGILANSPEAVAPHGQALAAAAGQSPFARSLATAGRSWLRVLANQVDPEEVTAAARGLARFGLTWDATRLASQAALHTPDGKVSGSMLQLARDLKSDVTDDAVPSAPARAAAAPGPAMPTWTRLSDREREVAELVLQGMPYRDIGNQLLISAKTVEHHVARIRRRLGAESRSEMLSMLRALVGPQG